MARIDQLEELVPRLHQAKLHLHVALVSIHSNHPALNIQQSHILTLV